MKIYGLTGGIGSGKSTVSKMLQDLGHIVVDADFLAREVVAPGSFGLRALVQNFGSAIVDDKGLKRSVLREKIFESEETRLLVERITHPLIQWRAKQEFDFQRSQGRIVIFYDAALIYEKNLVPNYNGVIVVYTTNEVQINRLMSREKISEESAEKILNSQWDLEKKKNMANFVLDNSGTIEETRVQVQALINKLKF